jgi:transketolase
MAEVKKIATRDSYGKALVELGAIDERVVAIDADLAGSTKTGMFKKAYPDRHFNCGIAECNVMGTAAGMAAMGLIPFASSFAMFASGRAWEVIRNSIGYPHLNVKICASHGGISVGEDGATHQCTEDLALMRQIPGMLVLCPCDGNEMRLAVEALLNYEGPAYLRLARPATEIFTDELEGYKFELGKGVTLAEGSDVTIIATGIMVGMALKARELLAAEGISARVIDMHTIKPLDEELVLKAARETGAVVTSEEASVLGGLGGAVAELLAENCPVPVVRHGVNDSFGRSGTANAVLEYYGLTPEVLAEKCRKAVAMKK